MSVPQKKYDSLSHSTIVKVQEKVKDPVEIQQEQNLSLFPIVKEEFIQQNEQLLNFMFAKIVSSAQILASQPLRQRCYYKTKLQENLATLQIPSNVKEQPSVYNKTISYPMFQKFDRKVLNIDITLQQERRYLLALKGKPVQTKSLHKYVKIITRRLLQKKMKFGYFSQLQRKAYQSYNQGNCTFMQMQRLIGFRQLSQQIFIEEPGHERVRNELLNFFSSPEMGRVSMMGVMYFHQKVAMLKYLERLCDLMVYPSQMNWK